MDQNKITANVNKNKVNFIFNESIELPNSFILGLSFIFGSLSGSILNSSYSYRNK